MGDFKKLKVWQLAKDVAVEIYKLVGDNGKLKKDFGLKDQLTRSAVSIASNIAEGDELDTIKQAIKHFYIAKGSTAELMTQLIITKEIGLIKEEQADELIQKCNIISLSLYKLIEARKKWL
jgi:four helix bundle protein